MSWWHVAVASWFSFTAIWSVVSGLLNHGKPTSRARDIQEAEEKDAKAKALEETIQQAVHVDFKKFMSKEKTDVEELKSGTAVGILVAILFVFFQFWLAWKVGVTSGAIIILALLSGAQMAYSYRGYSNFEIGKNSRVNGWLSLVLNCLEMGILAWGGLFTGIF